MERHQRVIGIPRETYNVWERRAPLSPCQVAILVKDDIRVIVQPSDRRIYSDKQYADEGAVIQEDLSEAKLILGVKTVQIDHLIPDKTYAFFSHVIKAQADNMPLLDAILEENIRLIDYEKMLDDNGRPVVADAFGRFAGICGMINILHGIGLRLLALGCHTAFMYIGPSNIYKTCEMAKEAVRETGRQIRDNGLPEAVGPMTFVFTGSGNVSMGAQEIFRELCHKFIDPKDLPEVAEVGAKDKLYGCVIRRKDYYERKDGGTFDLKEAKEHPELYTSSFSIKIAPYATCIVNGITWDVTSPRLLTISDAKTLMQPRGSWRITSLDGCSKIPHPLLAICDISADTNGSFEFTKDCTTIGSSFRVYDARKESERNSVEGDGILICSIDNMPAQLPQEATDLFGSHLLPYIKDMLKSDARLPFSDYDCSPVIKQSVIASNGSLTPNYQYIDRLRKASQPC